MTVKVPGLTETIDALPPSAQKELADFVDYLQYKHRLDRHDEVLKLGGLWEGIDFDVTDEDIRAQSVTLVQRTVDLSRTLAAHFTGKPKVIVHPGAMSMNTKLEKLALRKALVQSLQEIDCHGMEMLLENLPPYPWYFGGQWKGNYFMDADVICSFCEETGVNICFDLSHAALYCNAKEKDLSEFIRVVRPFIRHIHFADAYSSFC